MPCGDILPRFFFFPQENCCTMPAGLTEPQLHVNPNYIIQGQQFKPTSSTIDRQYTAFTAV